MGKIKKICKLEYAFIAYNLVFILYLLVAIPIEVIVTGKYSALVFAGSAVVGGLAGYACVKQRVKYSKLHLSALGFFAWTLVSVAYHSSSLLVDNVPHILLLFCLTVPSFLGFLTFSKEQYLMQWKVIATGYNLAVSALCALGLYCTFADLYLSFPAIGYNYVAFVDLKLYILTHYNGVGHYLAFAMILAIFMVCCAAKRWVRIVFAVDFLLLYITLGLTYSRTVELAIMACTAIAICYYIWHCALFTKIAHLLKRTLAQLAVCGITFVVVVALGYLGMVQVNTMTQDILNATRAEGITGPTRVTLTAAPSVADTAPTTLTTLAAQGDTQAVTSFALSTAQQAAFTQIAAIGSNENQATMTHEEYLAYLQDTRSLTDLSTMAARFYYWECALVYFISDAECQLWGTSPAGVAPLLDEIILDANPPHTHNVFIQVLVALGIPGFLCFMALWGGALFGAAKAFFVGKQGFAADCLPLLLLLAFTALGLQENILFSSETSLMLPAFLMACASVATLSKKEPAV